MAKMKRQPRLEDGEWLTRDGTVVTLAVEEGWSNENRPSDGYMEELDLSTFSAARIGRPPLEPEPVSQRVNVRIPPDLHEAARAQARDERRSLGNLIRAALRRYVGE